MIGATLQALKVVARDDNTDTLVKITWEVTQGLQLSPTLFNIYIADEYGDTFTKAMNNKRYGPRGREIRKYACLQMK